MSLDYKLGIGTHSKMHEGMYDSNRHLRSFVPSHNNPHVPLYFDTVETEKILSDKEFRYLRRPFPLLNRLCAYLL
jgi:hypothetical protein